MFTCNMLRGSLSATGMETWERSLPIFLHKRFHKDNPSVSGFGQGSLVRRPVIFLISPDPPQSTIKKYIFIIEITKGIYIFLWLLF